MADQQDEEEFPHFRPKTSYLHVQILMSNLGQREQDMYYYGHNCEAGPWELCRLTDGETGETHRVWVRFPYPGEDWGKVMVTRFVLPTSDGGAIRMCLPPEVCQPLGRLAAYAKIVPGERNPIIRRALESGWRPEMPRIIQRPTIVLPGGRPNGASH